MRAKLLTLSLILLVSSSVVQAADSVAIAIYNATEDVYMTGSGLYMTTSGGDTIDYELRISIENDGPLIGMSLGFRVYSDDGATWTYKAQPGGWGPGGQGTGLQAITVASGSRLDPPSSVFDMTSLLVTEENVDGAAADTIGMGGVAMLRSLAAGPLEHMVSIHFSLTNLAPGEVRSICFDSSFVVPAGIFAFTNLTGTNFPPAFGPALCFASTLTGVDDLSGLMPLTFSLEQNYPNPFNSGTTLEFSLSRRSAVELTIHNTLGQIVSTLLSEERSAGDHRLTWDGRDDFGRTVSSGVYFYRIEAGDFVTTRKMLLLK